MTNARFIVYAAIWLAFLAFGAQCFIDFSTENIASACIILGSTLAMLLYILWAGAIQTHPLSTFSIFGFCVTTQFGAMLAQSAYWEPLISNLRQPVDTFATLAFYQLLALIAHVIYRTFGRRLAGKHEAGLIESGLTHLGLYAAPKVGVLWLMGLVGMLSLVIRSSDIGTGGKVAQGIAFLAWAPLLIPIFIIELGKDYCKARRNYIFLIFYVCLFVIYGLAVNARGVMFSGVVTIALILLLRGLRSSELLNWGRTAKVLVLVPIIGVMMIPLSDLATAMVIARKDRGTATPVEMVEKTFDILQQPEIIEAYRKRGDGKYVMGAYDEKYINNPMLARFVETKFHDNALYFGQRLARADVNRLAAVTEDFLWATLPDPMLKALDIDVEKSNLFFSMGDYISHLGGAGNLGGYKTGSGFAQGIALFGSFFAVIYFIACFILFWAVDIFSYRAKGRGVAISVIGMLALWRMFQYGITAESLQHLFMAVVRGLPQTIILYLLVYHFCRLLINSISTFGSGRGIQSGVAVIK